MLTPINIGDVIKLVKLVYDIREGVEENKQEIWRFCRHADGILRMIQARMKDGNDLPPKTVRSLRRFHRNVLSIKDTIDALSRRSKITRFIFYSSLSKQIKRGFEETTLLVQQITLEQVIDHAAALRKLEIAQQCDRRNIDDQCREILERSNGGTNSRKLLEEMEIPAQEMEETLMSCSKRLNKGISSSVERAVLSSVTAALEARLGKKSSIPNECLTTSLDVVIHRDKLMGQGGYARVYEGTWQGRRVAVKKLIAGIERSVIESEVNVWRGLKHDNVVRFYAACSLSTSPFIVCELKHYGNINKYLGNYPQVDRRQLLTDACLGLEYLHRENVIHGDIKGSNILVGENGVACLCDFGFSRIKTFATTLTQHPDKIRRAGCGTMRWAAPEQLRNGGTSKEADVYSFAMTMYEIYSGNPPYVDFNEEVIYRRIRDGRKPQVLLDRADALERGLTSELWRIVTLSWRSRPKSRPSASIVAGWLKAQDSVYNSPGESDPEIDNSGGYSLKTGSRGRSEDLVERNMKRPPKLRNDASGVHFKRPSYFQSARYSNSNSDSSSPTSMRSSENHGNGAAYEARANSTDRGNYPPPPYPPLPPNYRVEPTGQTFMIPLSGGTSALGGYPMPILKDTMNGTLFPLDMGPPPPGAVPALQLERGTIYPMPPSSSGPGGMSRVQPAGTYVPKGPSTLHLFTPPTDGVKPKKSKRRLRWFS